MSLITSDFDLDVLEIYSKTECSTSEDIESFINQKIAAVYAAASLAFATICTSSFFFHSVGLSGRLVQLFSRDPSTTFVTLFNLLRIYPVAISLNIWDADKNITRKFLVFEFCNIFAGLLISPLIAINMNLLATAFSVSVGLTALLATLSLNLPKSLMERCEKVARVALAIISIYPFYLAYLGSVSLTAVSIIFVGSTLSSYLISRMNGYRDLTKLNIYFDSMYSFMDIIADYLMIKIEEKPILFKIF